MELTSNAKGIILKFSFVILTFCVVLWFSVFSYALLYYLYIPAVAHVKPVYLRYDVSCIKGEKCLFPHDNITLVERDHYELLSRGQVYAIELILDMPETERNIDQGMFMVRLDMLSQKGVTLKSSQRPAILRYRSPLFKIIYTLFFAPAFLAGTTEEKQSLAIPLFEMYQENYYQPTYFAFVEIQARSAEIYSCSLRIHAQFTGLRYMMYYWPILSAVVGIGSCFVLVSLMLIFIWVHQIMNTSQFINLTSLTEEQKGLVHEIRQSVKKSQGVPRQATGIQRRSDPANIDDDDYEIEDVSPYQDLPKRIPHSEHQDSSSVSDDEYSFCEGGFTDRVFEELKSDEIEDILSMSRAAESESSSKTSVVRRRLVAE